MQTFEYTFTGFMPSGNPFLWYYDKFKNTAFTTSVSVATWSEEPKIGDKIKFEKSGDYNEKTERIFINNKLVFEYSGEKEKQKEAIYDQIYCDLKTEKGF